MPPAPPTAAQLNARCAALPIFPLPELVFIPHTLLPLHVFEPRYRDLLSDCLAGDRLMAVPSLAPGWRQGGDRPDVLPVMGIGQVLRHQPLDGGASNIVLLGVGRARFIEEAGGDTSYRVIRAALIDEAPCTGAAIAAAALRLRVAIGQLITAHPAVSGPLSQLLEPDRTATEMADALAHLALRPPADRQSYLRLTDPVDRIDLVLAAISGLLFDETPPAS